MHPISKENLQMELSNDQKMESKLNDHEIKKFAAISSYYFCSKSLGPTVFVLFFYAFCQLPIRILFFYYFSGNISTHRPEVSSWLWLNCILTLLLLFIIVLSTKYLLMRGIFGKVVDMFDLFSLKGNLSRPTTSEDRRASVVKHIDSGESPPSQHSNHGSGNNHSSRKTEDTSISSPSIPASKELFLATKVSPVDLFIQQALMVCVSAYNILLCVVYYSQSNCLFYVHHFNGDLDGLLFSNCSEQTEYSQPQSSEIYCFFLMSLPFLTLFLFPECLVAVHLVHALVVTALSFIFISTPWLSSSSFNHHLSSSSKSSFDSRNPALYTWIAIWLVGGCLLIYDNYLLKVRCFEMHEMNLKLSEERIGLSSANQATEMRQLIGNVAHDLKTPLASFTTGIEIIADIIKSHDSFDDTPVDSNSFVQNDVEKKDPCLEHHDMIKCIKHCIKSIRETNTFMVMTINRCIDYTKASRGFKLVPKYETVDLLETLRLPLDCMKNIQERIDIRLVPLDVEICSHIITDKQWLQENILCLLSNAVKYSAGGEVTIKVYLTEPEDLPAKSPDKNFKGKQTHKGSDGKENSATVSYNRIFRGIAQRASFAMRSKYAKIEPNISNENPPDSMHAEGSFTTYPQHVGREILKESQREQSVTEKPTFQESDSNPRSLKQNPPNTRELSFAGKAGDHQLHLRFDVEDTGIGMSVEKMNLLFHPFCQAQRLAGGTGLGLFSLSKRIEALNGYYGVAPRADGKQGSLFWFTIPYRPDQTTAELLAALNTLQVSPPEGSINGDIGRSRSFETIGEESQRSMDQKVAGASTNQSKRPKTSSQALLRASILTNLELESIRTTPSSAQLVTRTLLPSSLQILLVDDSPSIIKMSSMMLRRQGHHIQVAENGDIALKKIQEQWEVHKKGFDVILMDLQMPVMDGLEATRRLRAMEREGREWLPVSKQTAISVDVHTEEQENEEDLPPMSMKSESISEKLRAFPGVTTPLSSPTGNLSRQLTSSFYNFALRSISSAVNLHPPMSPATPNRYGPSDDQRPIARVPSTPSRPATADFPPQQRTPERRQPSHDVNEQIESKPPQSCVHQLIIGVTANVDEETAEESISAGFDALMPKPFPMDLFNQTVLKAFHKMQESPE